MKTIIYNKISKLLNPEKTRKLRRPLRDLLWSTPIRIGEYFSSRKYASLTELLKSAELAHHQAERGDEMPETQVTRAQHEMLMHALRAARDVPGCIAEIGSWRGVTTTLIATNTDKTVYAVDPHPAGAFPGVDEAYEAFVERIRNVANIKYLRETSGTAIHSCGNEQFSLIFIDAMHDFISANFDIQTWLPQLSHGGFLALHDVDDHPGVNLAARNVMRYNHLLPWAYCPNMLVLRKLPVPSSST